MRLPMRQQRRVSPMFRQRQFAGEPSRSRYGSRSNNVRGSLALQIQISLRDPYLFTMSTRSRLPRNLGSTLPMGSRRRGSIASLETELRPTVTSKVETVHLEERRNPWQTRNCVTQGLPQTRVLVRVARTPGTIREQPGEENTPDDPK
jgi:hypothetical protein